MGLFSSITHAFHSAVPALTLGLLADKQFVSGATSVFHRLLTSPQPGTQSVQPHTDIAINQTPSPGTIGSPYQYGYASGYPYDPYYSYGGSPWDYSTPSPVYSIQQPALQAAGDYSTIPSDLSLAMLAASFL